MKKNGSHAIYLYCLARSDLLPAIEGIGLDGQSPLFLRTSQDIVAVLSAVSLDEFSGPYAESRMKDISWIGPRACQHEKVVEQVMRHSPVLPARFGTIYSSLAALEKLFEMHHAAISRFLDQVADKEEWSVKGLMDRAKAKEDLFSVILAREAGRLASSSPGMRYFQEQRIRSGVEKDLRSWLKEVCIQIQNDLSCYASDFCERKVLSRDATGMDTDMVLNCAYLVPRDLAGDFRARIDRANAEHTKRGLVLQPTGPWPPYSFCPFLGME